MDDKGILFVIAIQTPSTGLETRRLDTSSSKNAKKDAFGQAENTENGRLAATVQVNLHEEQ